MTDKEGFGMDGDEIFRCLNEALEASV